MYLYLNFNLYLYLYLVKIIFDNFISQRRLRSVALFPNGRSTLRTGNAMFEQKTVKINLT